VLSGGGPEDVRELTLLMASHMVFMGHAAASVEEAHRLCENALQNGSAIAKFKEMIAAQGGNPACVDDLSLFPRAAHKIEVCADRAGFVQSIDSTAIGMAGVVLGAGRRAVADAVDPGVSLFIRKKTGDRVHAGEPLVEILYNDASSLEDAKKRIHGAYAIGDEPARRPPWCTKSSTVKNECIGDRCATPIFAACLLRHERNRFSSGCTVSLRMHRWEILRDDTLPAPALRSGGAARHPPGNPRQPSNFRRTA
jgi:hypothetical protein